MTSNNNPPNPFAYVHIMDGYGFYITLSFIITALIFNIFLLVRIKYGDAVVTHLTLWPYRISLILLILMLVDTSISIVIFKEQQTLIIKILEFKKLQGISEEFSTYFMRFMGILEYLMMLIFVLTRAFEHRLLNFFIIYQNKFRL